MVRCYVYALPLFLIAAFFNLPVAWLVALLFAVNIFGFSFLLSRKPLFVGSAISLVVVPTILLAFAPMEDERITLRSDHAEFTGWRDGKIDRVGMRITRAVRKRFLGSRPGSTWTSRAGDEPGPHVTGFGWYWGPNGLIYGEDLGHRIAEWADTTPVVYDR